MLSKALTDARILWHMAKGHPKSEDHAANLHGFYARQAADYDAFRERLLPGRQALYESLALRPGSRLVELGAGTGRNVAWIGARLPTLDKVDLVDLCQPLLAQAARRWENAANVECHLADATRWQPQAPADAVVLAYALSMIPDWRSALANASAMLRPGGRIAVVDFTLPPEAARWRQMFWRRWFAHDGVSLDFEHCRALRAMFPQHQFTMGTTSLPYLPWTKVPYYAFIGEKSDHRATGKTS